MEDCVKLCANNVMFYIRDLSVHGFDVLENPETFLPENTLRDGCILKLGGLHKIMQFPVSLEKSGEAITLVLLLSSNWQKRNSVLLRVGGVALRPYSIFDTVVSKLPGLCGPWSLESENS